MKIKMDINRWRTAADVSVIECEPMYAGSMYVHKLFVEANLYENEVLQAEFRVGGESVAQMSLLYKEAIDEQYALYEALIPSKLFITAVPKQVDVVVGLFKLNNGVLSSILTTQSKSFTIEGESHVFENSMDEEEREMFNENLVHLTGKINEFNDIVERNEDIVSNVKEKVSNFKVGEITAQASEAGAEPQVEAEIVGSDYPNEFKLNIDFTLPRGEQGKAAGFGEITGDAMTLASNVPAEVLVETDGPNSAKNLKFHFGIPQGSQGVNGYDGTDGTAIFTTNIDFDESTTSIPLENINVIRNDGDVIAGDILLTPSGQMFRVIVGGKPILRPNVNVRSYTNIIGPTGSTPDITVTATVDNSVGTPSVTVTESGTLENPEINLAFHNLKGEQGEVVGAVTSVNGETGAVEITPEKIGAAAESGVYKDLVAGGLQGVYIKSGTDLNNLIPPANQLFEIYVCDGAALSNELVNTPVINMSVTFYMQVVKTWSGENKYYRVSQTLFTTNGKVYYRSVDYTSGDTPNWRAWTEIFTTMGGIINGGNLTIERSDPILALDTNEVAYSDTVTANKYVGKCWFRDKNNVVIGDLNTRKGTNDIRMTMGVRNKNNVLAYLNFIGSDNGSFHISPYPTDTVNLGDSVARWKAVYGTTFVPTLLYSSDNATTGEFDIDNGPFSKYNNMYLTVYDGTFWHGYIVHLADLIGSWQVYEAMNTLPRFIFKIGGTVSKSTFKIESMNAAVKKIRVYGF